MKNTLICIYSKCVLAVCGHNHPTMIEIHSFLLKSPQNLNSLNYQAILILEGITSALSTFNITTELRSLSKAPNPQLFPGRRSNMAAHCSGCVFTVCVCTWMG